ncbi:unnamed protein product [Nyctereutes procyonoides]|uniref:(raccoon dog) hypothetical protein n=1 Tax=Nyctereutes procyonoides TaxID=34880 RepID=A0A811ZF78_NYCPR|nr:unnamed protein product [Nyctereutes procyonoides]
MENNTEVMDFILVGLTGTPELQISLFIVFTLVYLISVLGNLGMTILILLDSRLHTPMYFFLSNLSLADFGYSTAVTPKVMAGLLRGDQVISYSACAAQISVQTPPLHHHHDNGCVARLAIGCYTCGFLNASIHVGNTFSLSFCNSNLVHHFFCDIPAVMTLSCSDKHISEVVLVYVSSFNVFFALLVIIISYLFIFITILRMQSPQGHQKALSTCASHLTAVSIFYGTIIFMYLQPSSSHSMDTDKIASVFYTMVIPMLNPVVYSLRNKEVKSAFKKFSEKAKSSLSL